MTLMRWERQLRPSPILRSGLSAWTSGGPRDGGRSSPASAAPASVPLRGARRPKGGQGEGRRVGGGPSGAADAKGQGPVRSVRCLQPGHLRRGHLMAKLGAFDAHRPPAKELVDVCVHCGFCLPTCPTYVLWNEEMDSPRGRIVLMNVALEEADELSDVMATHWDRCLGCMACG